MASVIFLARQPVLFSGDVNSFKNIFVPIFQFNLLYVFILQAYYGGEARCDIELGGSGDFDPSELVCGACSDVSRAQMCPKHGTDFLEYKCRYCCSVAVFFCFGTTHFCNACHDDFQRVTNIAKTELPACPAGKITKLICISLICILIHFN